MHDRPNQKEEEEEEEGQEEEEKENKEMGSSQSSSNSLTPPSILSSIPSFPPSLLPFSHLLQQVKMQKVRSSGRERVKTGSHDGFEGRATPGTTHQTKLGEEVAKIDKENPVRDAGRRE